MNVFGEWEAAHEPLARALFVGGAPPLSGETALAVVELLWAMADAVDGEYATEIEHYRARSRTLRSVPLPDAPWQHHEPDKQLRLDLGDDDYF